MSVRFSPSYGYEETIQKVPYHEGAWYVARDTGHMFADTPENAERIQLGNQGNWMESNPKSINYIHNRPCYQNKAFDDIDWDGITENLNQLTTNDQKHYYEVRNEEPNPELIERVTVTKLINGIIKTIIYNKEDLHIGEGGYSIGSDIIVANELTITILDLQITYFAPSAGIYFYCQDENNRVVSAVADYVYVPLNENYIPQSIARWNKIEAFFRIMQMKYEIVSIPREAIIDYREKEIRIYCPEGTAFVQQSVGEGGNPNMYYMTFRSYAPSTATYLKEGDQGKIIDEVIPLQGGSGTGVDEYGRAYKDHWLALAMLNEDGTWKYFGDTSTTEKYIGWTFVSEWYDNQDRLIDTDVIRINLSNKDCHLALAPYYG